MNCVEWSCSRCAFCSDAYFMDGMLVTYALVAIVFTYKYTYALCIYMSSNQLMQQDAQTQKF